MAISSPGIGSNLDVNGIIGQLMALEQRPLKALTTKEASYQAKLSAYGSLKGALSSFQGAVRGLSDVNKFMSVRASVGDASVLTASASSIAVASSHSLEVTQLAQAQKLVAGGQPSTTAAIGVGTLTFDFGTISGGAFDSVTGKYTGAGFSSSGSGIKTVTIGAGDNTLTGIRDAINNAKIGVTASIVSDGDAANPYRLVLSADNGGASNSMKITVSGDAALQSLLAHDPANNAGQALSQTVTAQNAVIKVDGLTVSKSSNTVTDVIQGVTLNLLKTNAGSPTTLTVAKDASGVKSAVDGFVKAYNDFNKTLKDLTGYDPETKQGGFLLGDSAARGIQRQIRGLLNQNLPGAGGSITGLAQLGIAFQRDGSLAVDSTKLQNAVSADPAGVAAMFATIGKPSDSLVSYVSGTANTKPGTYGLEITQIATQGKAVGSAAVASLDISTLNGNDTFTADINGVAVTVSLTNKIYASVSELAAELQTKLNGASALSSEGIAVTVSEAGGVLSLTSNKYGSTSTVANLSGNAAANLFGGGPTLTNGLDVAGTLGGATATGDGQYLTGADGSGASGLKLLVSGGNTGIRGEVGFSRGYAYRLDKLLDDLLSSKGPLASSTDGINESIKGLNERRDVLSRRLDSIEKRYRAQFTALDGLISNMTKTSSFLSQQLATLPKSS